MLATGHAELVDLGPSPPRSAPTSADVDQSPLLLVRFVAGLDALRRRDRQVQVRGLAGDIMG